MSSKESISEYLSSLKQGDAIYRKAGGTNLDKGRVARVTPSQIILVSGGRYNRKTGKSVGGPAWNSSNLVLPTAEVKKEWQALYLARWAQQTLPELFKSLTPAQQVELFRHANALAADNASAVSQPSIAEDI